MSYVLDINKKYLDVFNSIDKIVKKRIDNKEFMALGYSSNLDVICEMNIDMLNDLIEKYLFGKTINDIKNISVIYTTEDLLHAIIYFCSSGIGGEVDIENEKLFYEYFNFYSAIGGTAVQAAMALSKINCPSLVHLTDYSKEVCDILQNQYIFTIDENNNLINTGLKKQSSEQEIHVIVQFKKGDVILLNGIKMEIPASNRVIFTKSTVNKVLPLNKYYFKWVEDNAKNITSNVLSSFNVIVDKNILLERLEYIKKHLSIYKKNNPKGIVFFEDAHYHDYKIKFIVLEELYSHIDIVSLNEEELYSVLDLYGFRIEFVDIDCYINALHLLKEYFNVSRAVILHTKDYSLYVGDKLNIDIEYGLICGNMFASAKAAYGDYGTKDKFSSILDYPLSDLGIKYYNHIKQNSYRDTVILIPSKYIDKPKYTIGLGDCFVGGFQLCF